MTFVEIFLVLAKNIFRQRISSHTTRKWTYTYNLNEIRIDFCVFPFCWATTLG